MTNAQRATPIVSSPFVPQFLTGTLPEELRPTEQSRRLQIAVLWGKDRLLEVRDLAPGERFTIGPSEASLQVFHQLPMHGAFPLVDVDRDGTQVLVLPRSASPVALRDGREIELEDARAERIDVPVPCVRYALGIDERVVLQFASVQLLIRYVRPKPMKARPWYATLDHRFLSSFVVLGLIAALGVKLAHLVHMPPASLSDDLFKDKERIAKYLVVQEKPRQETRSGGKAAGKEGKLGRHDTVVDRAAPHLPQQAQHQPAQKKLGGLITAFAGLSGAAADVLGGGASGSIDDAFASVGRGTAPGNTAGLDGISIRGDGPGGGGHGPIGIGGLGEGPGGPGNHRGGEWELGAKRKATTKFLPHQVIADDPGYKDIVAKVVRKHWNEIRYCYERELQKDPGLSGKVSMYFEIGPTGDVMLANVRETSLDNADAQQCMTRLVLTWTFPAPKSGIVQVTYPFLFEVAR